ncbi:MAG: hypothetical protein ACSW8F_00375 [bacterium]
MLFRSFTGDYSLNGMHKYHSMISRAVQSKRPKKSVLFISMTEKNRQKKNPPMPICYCLRRKNPPARRRGERGVQPSLSSAFKAAAAVTAEPFRLPAASMARYCDDTIEKRPETIVR